MIQFRKTAGFTMIELLVAITILVLLSSVAIVSFSGSLKSSRNSKRRADLEMTRAALEMYRTVNKAYPLDSGSTEPVKFATLVTTLKSGGYLSSSPSDPMAGQDANFVYYYGSTTTQYQVCAYLELSPLPSYCTAQNTTLIGTLTAPTAVTPTTLCCLNSP